MSRHVPPPSPTYLDGSSDVVPSSLPVLLSPPLASRKVFLVLITIAIGLGLGHLAVVALTRLLDSEELLGLRRLLNFNEEQNLPTYFSTLLLLANSAVLLILAVNERRQGARDAPRARYWGGLAALFAFMSVDEAASIHELLNPPLRYVFGVSGLLYFPWVIPYAVLALVVALVSVPFLRELPRAVRVRMVIAGVVFLGGAVGVEALEGVLLGRNGYDYRAIEMELAYLAEEMLEMVGVIYFLATLLLYIELMGKPLRVGADLAPATGGAGGGESGTRYRLVGLDRSEGGP